MYVPWTACAPRLCKFSTGPQHSNAQSGMTSEKGLGIVLCFGLACSFSTLRCRTGGVPQQRNGGGINLRMQDQPAKCCMFFKQSGAHVCGRRTHDTSSKVPAGMPRVVPFASVLSMSCSGRSASVESCSAVRRLGPRTATSTSNAQRCSHQVAALCTSLLHPAMHTPCVCLSPSAPRGLRRPTVLFRTATTPPTKCGRAWNQNPETVVL